MELHKNVPKPQLVGAFVELIRDKTLDTLTSVVPAKRELLLGLKTNGEFYKQFKEAVEGAATDFAANHEDKQLADAITSDREFWGNSELEQAFTQIATKPLVYIGIYQPDNLADDANVRIIRKLFNSTIPHLAATEPKRIERGVQAFIRFLALRVMSIPALSGVYANYIAVMHGQAEAERFGQLTQILHQQYNALILIAEKLGPLANLESLLNRVQSSSIVIGVVVNHQEPDGVAMTEAEIRELVKKIMRCSNFDSASGQAQLVKELPEDIRHEIAQLPITNARAHMGNIVDACLKFSGGFAALLATVRFHAGGSIPFTELENYLGTLTDPRLRSTGNFS